VAREQLLEHFSYRHEEELIARLPGQEALRLRYNPRMDKDHWSRDELLKRYETGVWVFLIVAAAAFLGLILWMGYAILL
jgi:hypothetical protein